MRMKVRIYLHTTSYTEYTIYIVYIEYIVLLLVDIDDLLLF